MYRDVHHYWECSCCKKTYDYNKPEKYPPDLKAIYEQERAKIKEARDKEERRWANFDRYYKKNRLHLIARNRRWMKKHRWETSSRKFVKIVE